MAKTTEKQPESPVLQAMVDVEAAQSENLPAVVPENLPAVQDAPKSSSRYDYAGAGLEGTTQDSFAIPFLTVLQKSSPQVDQDSGVALPEARAGMIYNTVTGKLYDGKKGITLIHCAQRRVFLRWRPRGMEGAGFRGEVMPENVAEMRAKGQIIEHENRLYAPSHDGSPPNDKRNDRFADTRNHYVLVVEDDESTTQALLSLTSTQIKKSKNLLALLANVKRKHPKTGRMVTPATFDNLIRMTTVPESNDSGSWSGVKFEMIGPIPEDHDDWFEAAVEFYELVKKDNVTVRYDEDVVADKPARSGGGRGGADIDADDIPF